MAFKIFDADKLYALKIGQAIERATPNAIEFYTRVPNGWVRDRVVTVENPHGAPIQTATSVFIPIYKKQY